MKPGQFPARPLWFEVAYADGSRVRGDTPAAWEAAPTDGVVAVRQPVADVYFNNGDQSYRHFTTRCLGDDYYWLDAEGIIRSGNLEAAVVAGRELPQRMKRGAWTTDDAFLEVLNEFSQDVPTPADIESR